MAKEPPSVVEILPGAWEDLIEGAAFYEKQLPSLGERFMEEMLVQLGKLADRPGTHSQRFEHFFALAEVWPWAMYYLVEGERIIVTAVLDCRRSPAYIESRITGT
jgi:hypothetical protein